MISKIKVLHLLDNWPNELWVNAGIFYKKLIENFEKRDELLLTKVLILKYNPYEYIKLAFIRRKSHYLLPFCRIKSYLDYKNLIFIFYPSLSKKFISQSIYLLNKFALNNIIKLIQSNNIDLIHAHNTIPAGYLAMEVKKKLGIPYIIHIHGRDVQEYKNFNEIEQKLIKDVFINANGIISNSLKIQNLIIKLIGNHNYIITLPFGVDKNKNVNHYKKNDPIKLVSVCNLYPVKSIDIVLKACALLKNKFKFEYHIIGQGPEYTKLLKLTNYLKINDRVKFLGALRNDEVINILPEYDIFVLPSINEAFGNAYLEALSAGLPCIAVEGQGCKDIDPNSEAILYVKPSDEIDLASKIAMLIADEDRRKKMGLNGIKITTERYNWDKIINDYCYYYKKLIRMNYFKISNEPEN